MGVDHLVRHWIAVALGLAVVAADRIAAAEVAVGRTAVAGAAVDRIAAADLDRLAGRTAAGPMMGADREEERILRIVTCHTMGNQHYVSRSAPISSRRRWGAIRLLLRLLLRRGTRRRGRSAPSSRCSSLCRGEFRCETHNLEM